MQAETDMQWRNLSANLRAWGQGLLILAPILYQNHPSHEVGVNPRMSCNSRGESRVRTETHV